MYPAMTAPSQTCTLDDDVVSVVGVVMLWGKIRGDKHQIDTKYARVSASGARSSDGSRQTGGHVRKRVGVTEKCRN